MGKSSIIDEFNKLCKQSNVICAKVNKTRRARNKETEDLYKRLYKLPSEELFNLNDVQAIFGCNVLKFEDIAYDKSSAYICHTNLIEHEVYKKFSLCDNRSNELIPKNHISRKRNVDFSKYPICDQMTATAKKIDSYLQVANVGSPTRYQGREIEVGDQCYYLVEEGSFFTGREIYTVGTRCQDINSLHIVIVDVAYYKDPEDIKGTKVVQAETLDIPNHEKTYKFVTEGQMSKILKEYGRPGTYYRKDIITSGTNIIYSTLPNCALSAFADINEDPNNYTVTFKKRRPGAMKTIRSICKKDPTMHFDFMQKVYDIVKSEIRPPRIKNPTKCSMKQFEKLCDIYSAFPTILAKAPMPKAGMIFEEYDKDRLNFYIYRGEVVSKGSVITEELADLLGESEFAFSTEKQIGCKMGQYAYEQSRKSKEKKAAVNKQFKWGMLESDFYKREELCIDGKFEFVYVRHNENVLELVACALWSSLCKVMIEAVNSINATEFFVVTDGLYYNGDTMPTIPEWCDYRIEDKKSGKEGPEKYNNILFKTYDDPQTEADKKRKRDREQKQKKRAEMTEEQKAEQRAKDAARKRAARAKNKE